MCVKRASLAWLIGLQLVACGSSPLGKDAPSPTENPETLLPAPRDIDESQPALVNLESFMIFDSLVPSNSKTLLKQDLRRIERTSLETGTDNDIALKELLTLPDLKAETLSNWLKERVKVMISDKLSLYRISLVRQNERRLFVFPQEQDSAPGDKNVLATMYGMALYVESKRFRGLDTRNSYLAIEVNNQWVHANTQRNGVMMIGPALFDPRLQPDKSNGGAYANSALRIATLFHEARHADGNAVSMSLGFGHAICPSGDYKGRPACDANANGPYSVSYRMLKAYIERCGSFCSEYERRFLETAMLDNLSRVVPPQGITSLELDTKPESDFPKVDITSFQLILLRSSNGT